MSPEVLTELVAKISTDARELRSGLVDAEKQTEASSKKMQESLRKVGLAMAASGAAITAALGLMGKAAIDESINIKRLSTTMHNAGVEYNDVKDSLEALIATTQRKTGIADNEQRDILTRLILVTKDYGKAVELLPTVLDLAAAGEMNATTAATYLGKAFLELEGGAKEVTIRFGQASLQFASMKDIQDRVRNSAEELANPFSVLFALTGDLSEQIGSFFVPAIRDAIDKISEIISRMTDWSKVNPELSKSLAFITLGTGGILALTGGIILLLPSIARMIEGFRAVAISAGVAKGAVLGFYSAILLIPIAIAGVIAAYEKLKGQWSKESLDPPAIAWAHLDKQIRDTGGTLQKVRDSVKVFTEADIARWEKAGWTIERIGGASETAAEKIKGSQEAVKGAIQKLREAYGDLGDAIKSKADQARSAADISRAALDRELDKARESYDVQSGFITNLYNEKIRLLNAGASEAIKAIQDQIDAIDKQTSVEDRAIRETQDTERKAELTRAIQTAASRGNAEDLARAKKNLSDFIADVERRHLLDQRQAEKAALRDSIENIRTATQVQEDALRKELQAAQDAERDKLIAVEGRIKKEKTLLEAELKDEIIRLGFELKAKELNEIEKLGIVKNALLDEENANRESLEQRLRDAAAYLERLRSLFGGGIGVEVPMTPSPITQPIPPWVPEFAHGGVVSGAIGEPMLATVYGGEPIIPANESAGNNVIVNFTQPVFFDREDTMNRFVDLIRKGIQRQDRLRFGGAYAG